MLSAVTAAVLAVTGLSACRSKVGAAAVVAGKRISESDVQSYLTSTGPTKAALDRAKQAGQTLVPRSLAANTLVQQKVFEQALARTAGGVPPADALNALHDKAASTLLGTTEAGAVLDKDIASSLEAEGLQAKFLPLFIRQIELEYALIERVKATTAAELAKAIADQHVNVSVNPRYGAWDASTFQLSTTPNAGLPDFLQPAPAASSSPAASS
jgi:hypothetical protein